MSIFKCKMCGGTIEFEQGATVGVCDSCGTKQTLPTADDEVIANLHNRANTLRLKCEFDKAEEIYNKILVNNPNDAEAHWGIILCKYGIEYVEDPKTYKRIPTCHRTSFEAILADEDYKAASENGDAAQCELYEAEAKEIDRLQKDILAIVKNEKPFDVFICYKETDENGKRTQDSVIANDIYYQLTQEGFKVFYAAITLEDKLGQEYEPYIFAALNSAKVMLVVGSKSEYFAAVWVKNEWSRYLKLMKTDRSKLLIPCYRDIDAYELPEEFAHLQAQDMSKIGFINDLVRGIKKVVADSAPKTAVKETVVVNGGNAGTAPLLKRAFLFLEDGEWNKADNFCEQVLNQDPENAEAYLGKLMAELQVRNRKQLADCAEPFDNRDNYSKVLRFGDGALETEMRGYIMTIKYRDAENTMNAANTELAFKTAAEKFASIPGFKDADTLAEQCLEKAEVCRETAHKDAIYEYAKQNMAGTNTGGIPSYQTALIKFQSIPGWRDSDELAIACQKKIEEIKAKEEADRLEWERKAEERRIAAEKAAKKRKKAFAIGTPIVCACIAFLIVLTTVIIPKQKLNKAMGLLDSGKYEEAYALLYSIPKKYNSEYLEKFVVVPTQKIYVYSDGSKSTCEYEYDSNGNVIKETHTYSNGSKSTYEYEYEYDSNGNVIKIISDGSKRTYEYEYDSNGNVIKETHTYSDGSKITFEYEYDSNGNIIKETRTYSVGAKDTYEYEYDSNGNVIKIISDGSKITYEYEYDSNGNVIKKIYTSSNGSKSTYEYEYEYDSNGNVIKEIYVSSDGSKSTYKYSGYLYFYKSAA